MAASAAIVGFSHSRARHAGGFSRQRRAGRQKRRDTSMQEELAAS